MTTAADSVRFRPPTPLPSPANGVALWWGSLECDAAVRKTIAAWLSADEQKRMQRFGNDALRSRYLVGRASLRWILAQALGARPHDIEIVRGRRGRPQLAHAANIDFNVSHTENVALFAMCGAGRIGVDVERDDRVIHSAGLVRRVLTERERAALPSNGDAARRRILRLWTCKEALAKATGDAMSAPFRRLDIAAEPALSLVAGPAPYDADDFALLPAAVPDGYLATVALWHPRNAGGPSEA